MNYSLEKLHFALGIPGMATLQEIGVENMKAVHEKWIRNMADFKNEITVFKGIAEVIEIVSSYKIRTGIVTSKHVKSLSMISSHLDYIHILNTLFVWKIQ